MLLDYLCAQLFVLNSVSRARFQELEASLRKEDKEGRYFVSLKGPHEAPPRYHVSSTLGPDRLA